MSDRFTTSNPRFLTSLAEKDDVNALATNFSNCKGFCFIGRSNVGKSSLINSIFGKKLAYISKKPGKTQSINIFTFEPFNDRKISTQFYFFDLPGYGHAKVSKEMFNKWDKLIDNFFSLIKANNKVFIFHLQDIRHPQQKSDNHFIKWINFFKNEKNLILTKMDTLKNQSDRYKADKFIELIKAQKIYDNVLTTSTKDIKSINNLRSFILNKLD